MELFRDYVKRFKAEKAKIVGCDDLITSAAFQKGLPADHPLFGELIMKEDQTLADYFALAEKHALWDDKQTRHPSSLEKNQQQLKRRRTGSSTITKAGRSPSVWTDPQPKKAQCPRTTLSSRSRSSKSSATSRKNHGSSYQNNRREILPSWTTLRTAYTNDCYNWKNYLEKMVKEGKVDKYLDKPAAHPSRNVDADEESPTKTIQINGIFAKSEHLWATNNSKKRKIQQSLLVSQVQAFNTQLDPSLASPSSMPRA